MSFLAENTEDGFGAHRDKKYPICKMKYTAVLLMLGHIFLPEILDIFFRYKASWVLSNTNRSKMYCLYGKSYMLDLPTGQWSTSKHKNQNRNWSLRTKPSFCHSDLNPIIQVLNMINCGQCYHRKTFISLWDFPPIWSLILQWKVRFFCNFTITY